MFIHDVLKQFYETIQFQIINVLINNAFSICFIDNHITNQKKILHFNEFFFAIATTKYLIIRNIV